MESLAHVPMDISLPSESSKDLHTLNLTLMRHTGAPRPGMLSAEFVVLSQLARQLQGAAQPYCRSLTTLMNIAKSQEQSGLSLQCSDAYIISQLSRLRAVGPATTVCWLLSLEALSQLARDLNWPSFSQQQLKAARHHLRLVAPAQEAAMMAMAGPMAPPPPPPPAAAMGKVSGGCPALCMGLRLGMGTARGGQPRHAPCGTHMPAHRPADPGTHPARLQSCCPCQGGCALLLGLLGLQPGLAPAHTGQRLSQSTDLHPVAACRPAPPCHGERPPAHHPPCPAHLPGAQRMNQMLLGTSAAAAVMRRRRSTPAAAAPPLAAPSLREQTAAAWGMTSRWQQPLPLPARSMPERRQPPHQQGRHQAPETSRCS